MSPHCSGFSNAVPDRTGAGRLQGHIRPGPGAGEAVSTRISGVVHLHHVRV